MKQHTQSDTVLAGYVTRDELARQLGCSIRTLDRWHAMRSGVRRQNEWDGGELFLTEALAHQG